MHAEYKFPVPFAQLVVKSLTCKLKKVALISRRVNKLWRGSQLELWLIVKEDRGMVSLLIFEWVFCKIKWKDQ